MPQGEKTKLLWQNLEYRNNILESRKGRRLTEKHKKKLSIIFKNRKFTKEWRNKISLSHQGKSFSQEHKGNLSLAHIGIHSGKKHPKWKGGKRRYYQKIANAVYREHHLNILCENCGSSNKIHIHHIDKNVKNNQINNLQALCSSCHQNIHHRKTLDESLVNLTK